MRPIPGSWEIEGLNSVIFCNFFHLHFQELFAKNSTLNSILGCIYGNALGDALGLGISQNFTAIFSISIATEFLTKDQALKLFGKGPIPFPLFPRNFHNMVHKFNEFSRKFQEMA